MIWLGASSTADSRSRRCTTTQPRVPKILIHVQLFQPWFLTSRLQFRLTNCGVRNLVYLVEEHGEVNHAKLGERALEQAVANTQVRGRWKQMVEGGGGLYWQW